MGPHEPHLLLIVNVNCFCSTLTMSPYRIPRGATDAAHRVTDCWRHRLATGKVTQIKNGATWAPFLYSVSVNYVWDTLTSLA